MEGVLLELRERPLSQQNQHGHRHRKPDSPHTAMAGNYHRRDFPIVIGRGAEQLCATLQTATTEYLTYSKILLTTLTMTSTII